MKFNFVLCSPNDCSSAKTRHLNALGKLKSSLASHVIQCKLASESSAHVQSFFANITYLKLQYRNLQSQGLTFEKFRVGTTCQGTILPAWPTELQRETLINDGRKAKNNTSCNAGIISKLCAYCKSQNENSGLTS